MKDISRRDFLKGAAASAIGMAATGLTGAVAFADDAPAAEAGGLRYDENGVCVNTNLQAIHPDGSPIEGLYVIGNDMGGFFRHNYPQMFAGTAHGKTTCFARLASLHAMTGSIYKD